LAVRGRDPYLHLETGRLPRAAPAHQTTRPRPRHRLAQRNEFGGLVAYARLLEQAGAAALELNFYYVATDMFEDAASVERRLVDIVAVLKESIALPLAVKLSPFYSALPHLASQLDRMGADGLVLFNRFYQPDINPKSRETVMRIHLSDSPELLLRLRWIAILRNQLN